MADFISREAALSCFSDWIDRYGHEHTADEMVEYQRIEDLPVVDVVEIVRCGDCYAYRRDPELAKAADLDPEQYCALLRCEFPSDGFCFYGSRGDNG